MAQLLDPELFLPEPEAATVRYTVISVDDHLVEPPDMFEGRLPAKLQDRAPKVVVDERGHEVWEFEGNAHYQPGMNAVAGRRPSSYGLEPFRFDQMRPGCYDVHERVKDMDLGGIWAAVNFPSMITGFCGRVYSTARDPELGQATTRAYNDWMVEEWWQQHPDRLIPLGITYLADPEKAAVEIRRNADRGVVAVTFPERPHKIGFPSIFDDSWDPVMRACAETDTVICQHVGSSGLADVAPGAPSGATATLFGQLALTSCAEWVWSGWPLRYPDLKIAMSEGGLGWVAMLLDRLDFMADRGEYLSNGYGPDVRPGDVVQRNFWFCTLDDRSTIDTRHRIGVEHIMLEVDYPHGDTTWPDTQRVVEDHWGHVPDDELQLMTHANAAKLFRHPLPGHDAAPD
jgi:predicted TIM-barrel fold metal-dependent hydrolase